MLRPLQPNGTLLTQFRHCSTARAPLSVGWQSTLPRHGLFQSTTLSIRPRPLVCHTGASGTLSADAWSADQNNVFPPGITRNLSIFRQPAADNTDSGERQPSSSGTNPPEPLAGAPTSQSHRELFTVNVAIGANVVIALAKLSVYAVSGSQALLAEAIHSVADVGNQLLLRTGIMRSRKAPTPEHPYGYMRDKFVWSLISAVGIFCLGSGVTIAHGVQGLLSPHAVEHMGATVAVLALSLVVEGISLHVAVRTVMQGAAARGLSFVEYVRRGMDPTSIAVMAEDGGAVAGLVIAGICTGMVYMTGNVMYDALGSLCVGTLLGAIAAFLIQRNRQLLLGRSMNAGDMARIMELLRCDPVINAVYDAKSEEIGPGIYRFKAEIDFSGDSVVARHLSRMESDTQVLYEQLKSASWTQDKRAVERVLQEYGTQIISAVGSEIDRIETDIKALVPGVRYVDLETDKGGVGAWRTTAVGAAKGGGPAASGGDKSGPKASVAGAEVQLPSDDPILPKDPQQL